MKKVIILIITLFCIIQVFGQQSEYGSFKPHNYFDNSPINFSTGSPVLNIPIWTANNNSLSFPVSLSYSTTGVRLREEPSCVGICWQLNAFGTISQIVRDEKDFLLYFDSPYESGGFRETGHYVISENKQGNAYYSNVEKSLDSEADMFRLNLPDLSYTFMYDNNGNFFTLTESDIKIDYFDTYDDNGVDKFKVFIITNTNGIKYMFENLKKEAYYYEVCNDNPALIKANDEWHITKVFNSNTKDSISFSYEYSFDSSYRKGSYSSFRYIKFDNDLYKKNYGNAALTRTNAGFRIKSIETNSEKVVFTMNDEIPTDNGFDQILEKIEVFDKNNNKILTYNFTYRVINNRIFLKKIQQSGSDENNLNPYYFTYNKPSNLTDIINNYGHLRKDRTDFWGFINNHESVTVSPWEYEFRFPNEEYTGLGLLNEILYPNGSVIKYEYEPNTYSFSNDNTNDRYDEQWLQILTENGYSSFESLTGPGARVKKIISTDGTQSYIQEYTYETNGISDGRLTNYPLLQYGFGYNDDPAGSDFESAIVKSNSSLNIDRGYIIYDKITVYNGGNEIDPVTSEIKGINGKTEYYYDTYSAEETHTNEDFPYALKIIPYNKNGLPLQKKVYDNNNNLKSINETNFITENTNRFSKSLKIVNNSAISDSYTSSGCPIVLISDDRDTSYLTGNYTVNQRNIHANNDISTLYSSDNSGETIVNTINYEYSRSGRTYLRPVRSINTLSNDDVVTTELYYPDDSEFDGDPAIELMRNRNILSPVIKKEVFNNGVKMTGERTLFREKTAGDYTIIVPDQLQIWEDGSYKTVNQFDVYDNKGRLLESHGIDGIKNSVLYAYNNTLPVATVINAGYDDFFYTSFEEDNGTEIITGEAKTGNKYYSGSYYFDFPEYFGVYTLTYWKKIANDWEYVEQELQYSQNGHTVNDGQIDEVRLIPKDAFISTVTYKPLIGKTSETDANGNSGYYEYDEFGRLIKVYDQDKNIVKENEYYFADYFKTISGQVKNSNGNGISGIELCYTGEGTTTTDDAGFYSKEVPVAWTGDITVSSECYNFTESSKSYSNVIEDISDQDFTGNSILLLSINAVPECGNGTIRVNSNFSENQTFYLYDSSGTLLADFNINDNHYDFTNRENGTYKAKITLNNCESEFSVSEQLVNHIVPEIPSTSNVSRCGTGELTFNALPPNGNSCRWYTTLTGGFYMPQQQECSFSIYLSSTTSYYVSSYNETTGCESESRTEVTGTIKTIPSVSVSATPDVGTGTITVHSNYSDNQTFYLLDNSCNNIDSWTGITNSHDFTEISGGTYKGKVEKDGCMSDCSSGVLLTLLNPNVTISGTVTSDGNPVNGVIIRYGGGYSVSTNSNGNYSIIVPRGWSGSVIPMILNYTVSPSYREYTDINSNYSNQNFNIEYNIH